MIASAAWSLSFQWSAFLALANNNPHKYLLGTTLVFHDVRLHLRIDKALQKSDEVLDVKLSSVDYAILLSTCFSVSTLHAMAKDDLLTQLIPRYPYVSVLNAAIIKLPLMSLK